MASRSVPRRLSHAGERLSNRLTSEGHRALEQANTWRNRRSCASGSPADRPSPNRKPLVPRDAVAESSQKRER